MPTRQGAQVWAGKALAYRVGAFGCAEDLDLEPRAVETDARKAGYAVLGDGYHVLQGEDLRHASSGGCWESMIMGVQSGREGAGGGNAIACTACGLTFFPACPLEGDAMRAALERMRGGGGDFLS